MEGCGGVSPARSDAIHHGSAGITLLDTPREWDTRTPWQTRWAAQHVLPDVI